MARIFILSGQSNMVGSGMTSELPQRARTSPCNVRLYMDGAFHELLAGERFGPEVGFAQAIAKARPQEAIVLCKVASSGANLFYDWNPDGVSRGEEDTYRGPLYPALLAHLADLRKLLAAEDDESVISGTLWMQGERDSVFEHMAEAYEANLRAFIGRLRMDLCSTDMPFVQGQIAPRIVEPDTGLHRHAYRDTVRAAQASVAKSMPGVSLVRTDDLPQSDNLHFTTLGLLELGGRFAQTWIGRPEPAWGRV